jgi:hypothetical protein
MTQGHCAAIKSMGTAVGSIVKKGQFCVRGSVNKSDTQGIVGVLIDEDK